MGWFSDSPGWGDFESGEKVARKSQKARDEMKAKARKDSPADDKDNASML